MKKKADSLWVRNRTTVDEESSVALLESILKMHWQQRLFDPRVLYPSDYISTHHLKDKYLVEPEGNFMFKTKSQNNYIFKNEFKSIQFESLKMQREKRLS